MAAHSGATVAAVSYRGRMMLVKRVVALSGEAVVFREEELYVVGNLIEEPYVHHRTNWELPPRTVAPGHVYVVGDNRGTPMSLHKFGEINMKRIVGGVL